MMKKLVKGLTLSAVAATAIFFVACSDSDQVKPAEAKAANIEIGYSGSSISLDDDKAVTTPEVKYSSAAPGSSKKIKRAFQDAPPMIPHSVEGLLPITKDNNQCITCHVDSAPYDKTIPAVPVSHMTDFRPVKSLALENKNTSSEKQANVSIKKIGHLYPGRFNCSQCHAPQADAKLLRGSKFTPDYIKKDGEFKSSWDENEFMKNIDTTK